MVVSKHDNIQFQISNIHSWHKIPVLLSTVPHSAAIEAGHHLVEPRTEKKTSFNSFLDIVFWERILTTLNIISIWSKDSSLLIVSELLSRRASMSLCLCVVLCLCVRVSVLKFQPHHCIVSGLLSWRASALNLPCVTPQTPSGLGIICYQAGGPARFRETPPAAASYPTLCNTIL